ncbi:metal ABC transporter substrate-binding protein [Halopenitus persicus]|uniref:Zinc transport system substrate-binding protein n=1 Tax=Halopenitus persicus TaxID=1048396 RepID=A0A1H3K0Y5_9EURY|nr:zinc ABC transporter substrate-binding protein [Halopenitus persicus]SDY45853.1 zinc transport system substrate-binding protein [Halopenitus persicus]
MTHTRRDLLAGTAGVLATSATAGCTGQLRRIAGERSLEKGGYAAFFTLYDFARHVGGETFPVENPIPTGTMGHAYEAGPELATEVASHELFVYLDVEGFQRWALDAAATIERDYPGVELVDALDGIELLAADADHAHESGDGHGTDDHDGEHETDGHGDHETADHETADHGETGTDETAADRSGVDPHYWTDPVRASQSVENVRAGLEAADPDNADVYAANAEAYRSRLEDVHATFEEGLADRTHGTVVLAGHNSYRYLGDRYDFTVHSPQGVSPHAEPNQDEISATIDLVDREGIDVILADHFGSNDLANTIVRNSTASEVREVSPAEGTTAEWNDRGWGYVEQLTEITLPALQAGLGVDA